MFQLVAIGSIDDDDDDDCDGTGLFVSGGSLKSTAPQPLHM